ncbi:DUF4350 domain-containing protein [Pedobacter africanus]|uniref:Unsaturated rhamnogalacturonyl hydrolase n=1 Tax=Pedobacter africanus TaxID=151894 RepID=A0A1W2CZ38_9SPHI|nr:hypothetical protein [Pedobacter africanus]SMC90481.1 unsaturated rhamnogalacturonyl hydrolase [Pedobacter africanus]
MLLKYVSRKNILAIVFCCLTTISSAIAQQKTVLLDNYFNHELKKDKSGKEIRFHYTWEDKTLNGFSMLGDIFTREGLSIKSLDMAPSTQNLKEASIYIIVDPDNQKESPVPNLISANDVNAIVNWVKKGGVLAIFANDSSNNNLVQLNDLSKRFGITFTNKSRNMVRDKKIEMGTVNVPSGNEVFPGSRKFYLKELAVIHAEKPAIPLIKEGEDTIMAICRYGKGTVFAVGDPWLYNEYIDGTRIPAEYENYNGAVELVKWLKKQIP